MSVEGTATNDVLKGKVIAIPQIDNTLTKEGFGADAKATGDKIKEIETKLEEVETNTTDKFLPLDGGELKGALKIKRYDNGFSTVDKNHSADVDYGTYMADTDKDGNSVKMSVSALYDTFSYTDKAGNVRKVHHEGNKPFGNYTGNGSATARTIDTGGIGRLCLIYCSDYVVLATPKGAFKVTLANSTVGWILATNLYYLNGQLIMNTGGEAVNKADETYYYQVI